LLSRAVRKEVKESGLKNPVDLFVSSD